jgi:sugar/nucleoside kinase (ribokinase family)
VFVVIGTTTLDVLMTGLDDLPTPSGDEFTPESISFTDDPPTMTLGGNGAKSAYVAAGLGLDTALCSIVADDAAGRMLSDWLAAGGVGLEGLRHDGSATSMTIVATDRDRARLSFHHPGSGRAYGPEDAPLRLIEAADILLLSGYHLLLGTRGAAGSGLLKRARSAGVTTAVDVGPIVPPSATQAEWSAILPHTDYLIGNEYELVTCMGATSLEAAAEGVLTAGVGCVVAKRGGAGSAGFTDTGRVDAVAFDVDVISTVGAGDAFNAGLFMGLMRDEELTSALRIGNAVAALVISSARGVLDGPGPADVTALLAGG